MNTDTGQVYRTPTDIEAALARGDLLVPISNAVAEMVEAGQALNRHERRRLAAITRTRKCDKR